MDSDNKTAMERTFPIVIMRQSRLDAKDHNTFEIVGVFASLVALASYVPITIDVFTHTDRYLLHISYAIYGLYIGANTLWLLYGIGHRSWAVIITSIIVISISIVLLIQISLFARRNSHSS